MAEQTTTKPVTRRRTNRRKRRQADHISGCGALAVLALLVGLILLALGGETPPVAQWTSALEENPYGPEDFALADGYMACLSGDYRMGIDVSEYQEEIDWEQVWAAGFDFAIVRIGYRGYMTGILHADERAWENLEGARAAGLDVGVYLYAQSTSVEEAREEARWCLDFLEGYPLDLPVVYDWEYVSAEARTGQMDKETLTQCALAFCTAIEEGGYQPMLYFNPHVSRTYLDLEQLADYPFWLAHYTDTMEFPYKVDLWQYTEEGRIPGIRGDVDIDLMLLYD